MEKDPKLNINIKNSKNSDINLIGGLCFADSVKLIAALKTNPYKMESCIGHFYIETVYRVSKKSDHDSDAKCSSMNIYTSVSANKMFCLEQDFDAKQCRDNIVSGNCKCPLISDTIGKILFPRFYDKQEKR